MSFEHKYLKYKQKYLELKKELQGIQSGGGFFDSESSDVLNIEKLTETPSLESSLPIQNGGNMEIEKSESPIENAELENIEDEVESSDSQSLEKLSTESNETDEQEGGNLETSISELDEIFSQLGGKKKEESSSSESDSDLESLSSLDDSSDIFEDDL